jgi:hypothetical protein
MPGAVGILPATTSHHRPSASGALILTHALPFLSEYRGLSTEDLLALEGQYRVDSLVLAFSEVLEGKSAPTAAERVVVTVEAAEREVNNGGFWLYFRNSSNEHASFLPQAFRAIGAEAAADLADRALTVIGAEEKWTPDAFISAAESLEESARERLNDLTQDYFLTGGAIAEMLFAYIKRNRGLIHTLGADAP